MHRLKSALKGILVLSVFAIIGAVIAIQITKRPIVPTGDVASLTLPAISPEVADAISFTIVVTATASAPEAAMFEGGSWFRVRELAHSAMLICHPNGLIVFDTGLGRDVASQFKDFPFMTQQMVSYEVTSPLADQKVMADFCPDRPIELAPSHLHWDHAGGIEDFPDLPVWAVPGALAMARSDGEEHGFLPSQLDAEILWKDLTFPDGAYANYPKSKDFFGDGSVVAVPMKGHTEGSIGMFVAMGNRQLFLTGDTTWALEGFQRPAHKFAMMRGLADKDLDALDAEILRVHMLMQAAPDLVVIPAHDVAAYPDWALNSR